MVRVHCDELKPQELQVEKCIKVAPTEVWSLCWYCNSEVHGVTIKEKPGQYTMECKNCGRCADAYHDYTAAMVAYGCW